MGDADDLDQTILTYAVDDNVPRAADTLIRFEPVPT